MRRALAKSGVFDARRAVPRPRFMSGLIAVWIVSGSLLHGQATPQSAPAPATSPVPATGSSAGTPGTVSAGGTLHGAIKSGNIPLPGVAVTATNTLTG